MEFQDKPFKRKKTGRVVVSASVSPEFWQRAVDHDIGWSEALRVGISMLLAEEGKEEYDNRLNIYRKMRFFQKQAEDSMQKVEELEKRLSEKESQNEKEQQ